MFQSKSTYKKTVKYLFVGLIAILQYHCVEPFNPEIKEYENLLVVDGIITDESFSATIKLSRTYPYRSIYPNPESNAIVTIYDQKGHIITLTEVEPGKYQSEEEAFEHSSESSYQLVIETSEGEVYESDYQTMKNSPPIDSIICEYEGESLNESAFPDQKLKFYINSHDERNSTVYYRWEWIETWEFHAPIGSNNYITKNVCYDSSISKNIYISTTQALSNDVVNRFPLYTINNTTGKLGRRYSLLVRQYALSKELYNFWSNLEKLNENGGTLFDPIPSQVTGNVININNPDEPVLGFFQVCGVSEKRITIDRSQLPDDFITQNTTDCEVFKVLAQYDITPFIISGWNYIDTVDDEYNGVPAKVHRFAKRTSCFDCTVLGTNNKPNYWDEISDLPQFKKSVQ